ncbi:hypothetical protein BG015_008909 [Linnemannia schmuckeri]|uniref:F-box domain-containing protein n=1 Tax=Linnemannia schmuckeri TaxID=64567 RepID=A0A9P5RYS2_9FUNG|nr:hypothetical protein BG015_008909 [Linnemannia schmuckeri]
MNRLFKKKYPPNASSPSSPIFNITEILEIVFSFLDDTSIRRSVLLVCRLWYHLNKHRVLRKVRWDWRWKRHQLETALARLPGARSFTCTCMAKFGEVDDALFAIMRALNRQSTLYQNLVDKQSRQQQQQCQHQRGTWRQLWQRDLVLPNISPLRELELFSFYFPSDNLTSNMFHFPTTLTTLKFTGGVYAGTIFWIDQILTDCPLLEVFHAGSGGAILVNGPWVPPTYNRSQPLKLRSLVLQNAKLDQKGLENLLSITPLLQELKLIELLAGTRLDFTDLPDSRYDWDRLYKRLVTLGLSLRSLQFTVHCGGRMPNTQIRQRMIELCPGNATNAEWSFSPTDITAALLQELAAVHNNVTVLELCVPRVWPRRFAACTIGRFTEGLQLLHQYLCESPNLVRLKCFTGAILLENLDLYHRARYTDLALGTDREWINRPGQAITVSKDRKKQVWACRNLRSLEVEVHSHEYEQLIWPVQSRILFGYIAAVCPKLEELDLKLPLYCLQRGPNAHTRRTVLYIQLEGGLCLLSKMEYLRTLKVERGARGAQDEESDIQKFDISWITPSGLNREKHRVQRRLAVEQWKQCLETEQQLEEKYVLSTDSQQQQGQMDGCDDEKLQESLQTLGLLSEVKKIVESMDSPEFRCFPSLERLSFGDAFEQRPADEIKRVFPRWYQGG